MHKRYSDGIDAFGKEAIKQKGSDFQREILEKSKLPPTEFVRWLDDRVAYFSDGDDVIMGDSDVLLPSTPKFTAGQFINPPADVMVEWYNTWKNIPMNAASSAGFWAYVTRRMIEQEKLLPCYLPMRTGTESGNGEDAGKDVIDQAIASGPEQMDKCVRNFCRHLSGLRAARGARSLYVNCCLARAWWKCHVAESALQQNWKDSALPIIREGGLWENLGEKMASSLTVLGDVNIRDGIVKFLLSDKGKNYRAGKQTTSLLLRVGAKTSWCAMGIFTPDEVCEQVAEIVTEQ